MIVLFAVQLDSNCQLQLFVVKLNDETVLAGWFYEHSAFNFTVILVNNTLIVV